MYFNSKHIATIIGDLRYLNNVFIQRWTEKHIKRDGEWKRERELYFCDLYATDEAQPSANRFCVVFAFTNTSQLVLLLSIFSSHTNW